MNKLKYTILIAVLGVFTLSSCGYNTMVNKQESVTAQWGQVQNAYQRRADLIPNLVSTVKGYATHEQETFTEVTEARARATQVNVNPEELTEEGLQQYQQAQGQLSAALGKLLMIRENYPELKANQNFLALQDELAGTENRIAVERNRFNEAARDYNQYIRRFPHVIYAGWFGFKKKGYFEADAASQTAPVVEF
ncbi:MAG: LemA family protein [Dysgonamonadaceae bacterium]|jgi:LemA protein|nr:LemA family protein [Dysgonamonadaceae bacterium]MDD3355407.1 LemA family protein [Dysgonamonadaceae bacterium]MDD3727222.1 LemA family protein [Dysgonamonadaceae bacterium]MDD4245986.1 LemA family protein [Dysgonamonadaceae bacterium]MDD4605765.1 LemA family protein [Dysgonamonadaceae bacterium]